MPLMLFFNTLQPIWLSRSDIVLKNKTIFFQNDLYFQKGIDNENKCILHKSFNNYSIKPFKINTPTNH